MVYNITHFYLRSLQATPSYFKSLPHLKCNPKLIFTLIQQVSSKTIPYSYENIPHSVFTHKRKQVRYISAVVLIYSSFRFPKGCACCKAIQRQNSRWSNERRRP